jgi:hypothetical protein
MARNLLWPFILVVALFDMWQRGSVSELNVAALIAGLLLLLATGVDAVRPPK